MRVSPSAVCHADSGSFLARGWVLRIWSSWRCKCAIGSGITAVLSRFALGRSSAAALAEQVLTPTAGAVAFQINDDVSTRVFTP